MDSGLPDVFWVLANRTIRLVTLCVKVGHRATPNIVISLCL